MGNQITPGDQIDDQIPTRNQNVKIRSPIWSPGAIWTPIWSSDVACFSSHLFKRPLIFAQKAQLQSNSGLHFGHLEQSGRPGTIWLPRSHLVAHQVAGASGRQSGRGNSALVFVSVFASELILN